MARRALDDPELFALFFQRHARDVHRFVARRTRNSMVADDITAATFEKCWKALPTYEPRSSTMRPWLFRIAANEVASYYRSEGRRRAREHLTAPRADVSTDYGRVDEEHGELLDAMAQLNDRYQLVLSLRFLTDLSTEDTAEALGVSNAHCAVLQHRALGALRKVMEGDRDD